MRQIVLDIEIIGLDLLFGYWIIEIGCVELCNWWFIGNNLYLYINLEWDIDEGVLEVYGIIREFFVDKFIFEQIVEEFMIFVDGVELVIYNVLFDVGFFDYELWCLGVKWGVVVECCWIFDILKMVRDLYLGQKNSLDVLCCCYDVENVYWELYGVLLDVEIFVDVYLVMIGGQIKLFLGGVDVGEQGSEQVEVICCLVVD